MVFNTPRDICCEYLLESPYRGDSNKYPQHMFLEVNKKKKRPLLPSIVFYVGILYNAKFVSTAKPYETSTVVMT